MGPLAIAVLAFSMSADAFAASLGKGACHRRPKISRALRSGLIFGSVEAIMPIIGWLFGSFASGYVASIDHWIAFTALVLLGGKMMHESRMPERPDRLPRKAGTATLVLTAFATSIDALVVGMTLAFLDVNIWIMAATIGLATFFMSALGTMIGQYAGNRFGRAAEGLGGLCLVLLGTLILIQHLTA